MLTAEGARPRDRNRGVEPILPRRGGYLQGSLKHKPEKTRFRGSAVGPARDLQPGNVSRPGAEAIYVSADLGGWSRALRGVWLRIRPPLTRDTCARGRASPSAFRWP